MSRRSFLRTTGAGALAGGLGIPAAARAAAQEGKAEWRNRMETMKYRRLGRTNFMVSEVGFGTNITTKDNVHLIAFALESGLNVVDAARRYMRGESEEVIGDVICSRHRDKVFLFSKSDAPDLLGNTERSLKALKTDVLDVQMAHRVEDPEVLRRDELLDGFAKLKKEGKIRFTGVSSHTNVVPVLLEAVRSGHFDMVLGAYSIINAKEFQQVIDLAKEKDVGVVAMKAARTELWRSYVERGKHRGLDLHEELRKATGIKETRIHEACYRWALDNPGVACVLSQMENRRMVQQNMKIPFLALK